MLCLLFLFVLHECKIHFCLVVDLFVDLHFFLPKSQIYLPFFGWSYIFIDEDLNLRSMFHLNEYHFFPPSAAMFGDRTGTGLHQTAEGRPGAQSSYLTRISRDYSFI